MFLFFNFSLVDPIPIADPDPGGGMNADSCPSGSAVLQCGLILFRDAIVAEVPGVNDTFKHLAAAYQAQRNPGLSHCSHTCKLDVYRSSK